jgi:hypothetical protein
MRYRKGITNVTIIALLLLVIGTGNVLMGYRKGLHFDEAVSALALKRADGGVTDPLPLERLESKRGFYRTVSLGGIGMLCCAALLLGLDIVRRRRP